MSSVPKYRRNESKIQFIDTFNTIRRDVIMILMRDFGIKERSYSIKLIEDIYNIEDEDKITLEEITEKYHISSASIDKYPSWLIDNWRNEILMILNNIGIHIHYANTIYINNVPEYIVRRNHWSGAIAYLIILKDKLQEIIFCIRGVKLGAYEIVFQSIDKEINLLKAVRKSDNKQYEKVKNKPIPMVYFDGFCYVNYSNIPYTKDVFNPSAINGSTNHIAPALPPNIIGDKINFNETNNKSNNKLKIMC